MSFLTTGDSFAEETCSNLSLFPNLYGSAGTADRTAPTKQAIPVCWDDVEAAVEDGGCTAVIVSAKPPAAHRSLRASQAPHHRKTKHNDDSVEQALVAAGCQVVLVTPATPSARAAQRHVSASLGVQDDPFAAIPAFSLKSLLDGQLQGKRYVQLACKLFV
jgi:hypothetical protein